MARPKVLDSCIPSRDSRNGLSKVVKRFGSEKSGKASSPPEDVGTGKSRCVGSSLEDPTPDIVSRNEEDYKDMKKVVKYSVCRERIAENEENGREEVVDGE